MSQIIKTTDPLRNEKLEAFDRLLMIMDELRENCPWDKKQTMESLRHLTIEETYELSDSILEGDLPEIKKELGDIMLHLVFYSKIADENKAFNLIDVLNGICDKLIHRHPHIYGDVKVNNEEFEYFAPLYVRKNGLPDGFIILRADGPSVYEQENQLYELGTLNKNKISYRKEWDDLYFKRLYRYCSYCRR